MRSTRPARQKLIDAKKRARAGDQDKVVYSLTFAEAQERLYISQTLLCPECEGVIRPKGRLKIPGMLHCGCSEYSLSADMQRQVLVSKLR